MLTTSSNYLNQIFESCLILGASETELRAVLPENGAALRNPSRRFESRLTATLLNCAAKSAKDPCIGIAVGSKIRPETFLDLGYAMYFCRDLSEVLLLNATYQPLTQQLGTTRLVRGRETDYIEWTPTYTDYDYNRHIVETLFSAYAVVGGGMLWGDQPPVLSARFRHSAPLELTRYKDAFCDNLEFGANYDRLEFVKSTFDVALPNSNPAMVAYLRKKLDKQLADLTAPIPTSQEVKRYILKVIQEHRPKIREVADVMGMSERTLRRRLEEEGESFRSVSEAARKEACETFMLAQTHNQSEIAFMLGFSDHSAYSRAFKAWFGVTPREYNATLNSDA